MSDIVMTKHYRDLDRADDLPLLGVSEYRLPSLPKLSVIANMNSAILAMILTVVFTLINQHGFVESIVYFSNLILCFGLGSIIAAASCVFDYMARRIYNSGGYKKLVIMDIAEIYDACALCVFVASLAIFTWGLYMTFHLLRNACG
ncbi:MAG: hypothetical protein WB816_15910 [Methylocystis sp.]